MSGNKEGGKKARDTKLKKYGNNYFKEIAVKGGKAPHSAPTGYGSKKVGKDGLTGVERLQKLWEERREHHEDSQSVSG